MYVELNKSKQERICQAILFEILANTFIISGFVMMTDVPLKNSALLSVLSAVTAMMWNYIFNMIFDKAQMVFKFERTWPVRLIHAGVFELGLIILLIPVAMLLLDINSYRAFMVETGLVVFFIPYTLIFNWVYDRIRWAITAGW
jgi:uncharacterized membrane protein